MMVPMLNADMKLLKEIDKWFYFDDNQDYVLRKDAPEEIKAALEILLKKYPPIFED